MDKKFGALTSSVDPSQLAATVEGIIMALSGVIIFIGWSFFGVHLVPADIQNSANTVGLAVSLGVAFFGSCKAVFGLIRKIIAAYYNRQQTAAQ